MLQWRINQTLRRHKAMPDDLGGNCASALLGLGQCECRPVKGCGGETIVLWHATERKSIDPHQMLLTKVLDHKGAQETLFPHGILWFNGHHETSK